MTSDTAHPAPGTPRSGTPRSVVRPVGDLDLDSAPVLIAAVEELVDLGHHHLVLDLAQLSFCDSMGLSAFLRLLRRTKSVGGSLTLMSPPDQVKRLLSMAGLDQILVRHEPDGQEPEPVRVVHL
ncbi:STAS domain-containing protein [Streptacidiphilus sp. PB12-B1b]|uniref:STAS domain-containing protein n=1 Tax=Streptacidiphilus sp. PB12-B1b TaxID=2705012 RepID=UPI0015F9745C|nr:STAS domain-containing protein [Streptacidiphilus sp. PB12-B1b]QMU76835.1 STAS domain-containing protein [Streptacidiphilus sp. PB12-B1b]